MSASCEATQGVQRCFEVFALRAEGRDFVIVLEFYLTLSFLVVTMEGCRHRFCSAELKFGGIHLQLPFHCSAPLPLPANLRQHA